MVLSCLGCYSPGLVLQNLGVRKVRMWPGGLSSPLRQVTSQSLRFLTCKGAGASVILKLGHVHTCVWDPPEQSLRQRLMRVSPAWHSALLSTWVNSSTWPLQTRHSHVAGIHHLHRYWTLWFWGSISHPYQKDNRSLSWSPSRPVFISLGPHSWITFPNKPSTHKPLGEPRHRHRVPEMALVGNSLVVQWLGLCTFTAEGSALIPGQGTKILQAARWHSQKKKKRNGPKKQSSG